MSKATVGGVLAAVVAAALGMASAYFGTDMKAAVCGDRTPAAQGQ